MESLASKLYKVLQDNKIDLDSGFTYKGVLHRITKSGNVQRFNTKTDQWEFPETFFTDIANNTVDKTKIKLANILKLGDTYYIPTFDPLKGLNITSRVYKRDKVDEFFVESGLASESPNGARQRVKIMIGALQRIMNED